MRAIRPEATGDITASDPAGTNAGIAWVSAMGTTGVPLWATPIIAGPSTITDTVGTVASDTAAPIVTM